MPSLVLEMGRFIPTTELYFRRFYTIYYYLNCYMFRSYDHLQVEIYLLGFTRLTTVNIMDHYIDRFDSWLLC
jgi:hypothetical protein